MPTPESNWCDRCEQHHNDIRGTHCAIGEHCTTIEYKCAGKAEFNSHGTVCCICGTRLDAKYQAQADITKTPAPQVRNVQTF